MQTQTAIRDAIAGFGCCEGYQNPGITRMRAAVDAVLGCHPPNPEAPVCLGCGRPYPCQEVRVIARALQLPIEGA